MTDKKRDHLLWAVLVISVINMAFYYQKPKLDTSALEQIRNDIAITKARQLETPLVIAVRTVINIDTKNKTIDFSHGTAHVVYGE